MRQLPLYPRALSKTVPPHSEVLIQVIPPSKPLQVFHRKVISPIAWRLIAFILHIARVLPGSQKLDIRDITPVPGRPARAPEAPATRSSRGIAAYRPLSREGDDL